MSKFTLNLKKIHSPKAKELTIKVLSGKQLTPTEWEVLYNEGVRKRPSKRKLKS